MTVLRDRLLAEFTVFGHRIDPTNPEAETAVSGVADAVALGSDGRIEVVVDWKSDVSPNSAMREKYRSQIRDYIQASGAEHGLLVYMTLGKVDEV